jgi:hypothetical protein
MVLSANPAGLAVQVANLLQGAVVSVPRNLRIATAIIPEKRAKTTRKSCYFRTSRVESALHCADQSSFGWVDRCRRVHYEAHTGEVGHPAMQVDGPESVGGTDGAVGIVGISGRKIGGGAGERM